jgi:hypothetical protein
VTILRFANVLGPDVETSHKKLFSLPVVPMILGFDPRYQFVHEDDVVHALEHAVKGTRPGVYNVAADGVLALSEVAGLLGKQYAPILPPWGTGLAAAALRRIGIRISPEMLNQLRFGRGVDNRRYKAGGFSYRYTTREAVLKLAEHLRLHPLVRAAQEPYRYEREVEEFLRWSPHVRSAQRAPALTRTQLIELERLLAAYADTAGLNEAEAERPEPGPGPAPEPTPEPRPGPPPDPRPEPTPPHAGDSRPGGAVPPHYDDLEGDEIVPLLGSLEREDLLVGDPVGDPLPVARRHPCSFSRRRTSRRWGTCRR